MSHKRNRHLLLGAAFLRALATGLLGVTLGLHLARTGLSPGSVGFVVGAGLLGCATATLLATLGGDRIGARRLLLVLALLGTLGALAATGARTVPALAALAFFGMLNGMGRDRGAALALEQALLPATTTDRGRTGAFARYNLLQDAGHAGGALLAGVLPLPAALPVAAGLSLSTGLLYLGLDGAAGVASSRPVPLSPGSRRVLMRLSSLFLVDSLAGGFLTTSLVALFFERRFGTGPAVLGPLFAGARVLNALSHLLAAVLAARIGLVRTMVFTHLPSSFLLVTVAFAPSFPVAAALFLLREGLVEMDVPTRQSYVMAVVRPEERTRASGITALVRMGGWAVAPSFAGLFMQGLSLGAPLLVAAAMKATYDVLLYAAFRSVRPPEEGRVEALAPLQSPRR